MLKKIFSVLLTVTMFTNLGVFAELQENEGVYTEDFENYASAEDITTDDTLIKEFTSSAPELGQIETSAVMVVNSQSNGENAVFTNPALFNGDLNVFKCKIGADSSPKLNWKSASSLVFSHTNESGTMVNDYIFDFAWSLVRHKENGTTEKPICGFTPQKLYNVEIKASKVNVEDEYYYQVDYVVEGNEYTVSFPTTADGQMCIGFKSTLGNKLYIDDIEVYTLTTVIPEVNIAGRKDVSVKPQIEVAFSDSIDETTLNPNDICVGDVVAESIECIENNKYLITLSQALEKDTEYTLDISAVLDLNGNPLSKSEFTFKTRNTSLVIENSEVVNTSSDESESVVIIVPGYDENGAMVNQTTQSCEIASGESYTAPGDDYIVLTSDYKPVDATVFVGDAEIAADTFNAEYDKEQNKLSVYGKTVSSLKGEMIAVMVETAYGELDYAGITKTSKDGYFSISYTKEMLSGTYRVYAKSMQEEFSGKVIIPRDEEKPLKENFDALDDASDIISKELLNEFTKLEPELDVIDDNKVMAVNSTSSADNIIYTNSDLFNKELNIIKCKIGADSSPKLNWASTSSLVFSHTNDTGVMVDDYIFDFAWSLVRHRENGITEKGICGFTPKKMYNVELRISKVTDNNKYYYHIIYIVDGNEYSIDFATAKESKMRIGFKSTSGNKLYVDDIEVSGFTMVQPEINIEGRNDVSVKPEIEIAFSDMIDDSTLVAENIFVGDVVAENVEWVEENKYVVTLSQPLEKNTEYILDISAVRDLNGNALKKSEFSFKTKNTAVVIEDGAVVNTSSDASENIIIVIPSYDANGTMINKSVTNCELTAGEDIVPGASKYIVLTNDYKPIDANVFVSGVNNLSDEFKAEFDSQAQKVNISGKTKSSFNGEMVAVTVTDSEGAVDYTCITKTDANGYFSIRYTPVSESGKYTVFAKTMSEEFSGNVKIRLKNDIDGLLAVVDGGNTNSIADALDAYENVLAIDIDLYNNSTDKSFICSQIAKNDYTTIEALVSDIEALAVIDAVKSSDDKIEVFKNYESVILSSDDSAYEMWDGLSDSDKDSVLDKVIENKDYAPEAFVDSVYIHSILKMVSQTNKYIDVKNAIEEYGELLGLDLKDYNKANKPTSVAKGLAGKKWTLKSFTDKFNALVKEALKSDSNTNGPSGGGGGGGSSSSMSANIPMPQITPEPMEVPAKTEFADVDSEFWANEAIYSLCERKILNGYDDGNFRPNENITREEFVTVIVRYLGLELNAQCDFSDVSENDWFSKYVAAAYSNKIVNGVSETEFGKGRPITRQDAAVILNNIGKLTSESSEFAFADSDKIADYAVEAIKVLSGKGIINGNPDGTFNPTGALTRAQAAKMIFAYDKEGSR